MRERTDGEGFATRAIHAGERPDPVTHAHNTPIYATATFAFDTAAEKEDAVDRAMAWDPTAYFYSRTGNPTNRALEEKIASLEGAEDCVVAASGMASVSATLFAHLESGDHLVVGDELFAITRVLMEEDLPRRGIGVTPVDMTDLAAVEAAITPATKLLFLETLDEPAAADRRPRRDRGARPIAAGSRSSPTTRSSGPALLRPLEHGADLVLHAATKYLSGHGDAVSGVVSGSEDLHRPDPQADRHVRPGGEPVRELPRAARRADAAAAVARRARRTRRPLAAFLEADPRVEWVRYPGLASHPDHAVATRLLGDRYGAMVTFKPRGGVDGHGGVHRPPAAVRHRRQPGRRVHARLPAAEARRARSACRSAARTSTTWSPTSSSGLSFVA